MIRSRRVMSLLLSKELNFVFKAKRQCSLNLHPACQLEIALGQLTADSIRTDRACTCCELGRGRGQPCVLSIGKRRMLYKGTSAAVAIGCLLWCEGLKRSFFLLRIRPPSSSDADHRPIAKRAPPPPPPVKRLTYRRLKQCEGGN